MISKELLQCLNEHLTIDEIISTDSKRMDNNIYWSIKEVDILQCKNIYELAHKCKEWALDKGYKVNSRLTGKDNNGYAEIIKTNSCTFIYSNYSKIEPEAIFKVCEWILNYKES
jgi:hypothetical protein